ncbi:hypothetical protein PR048_030617 [Dryococelus australis]|uniref:Uncharacterized protein n=1 Tax=Dryococelus australis TaxID=614101 RepID=A0ABQ9GDA3_9NEOP|nr:hypothetical protein PR048_030617 [Dryococelus australis]
MNQKTPNSSFTQQKQQHTSTPYPAHSVSSPEKVYASLSKVEKAYNSIQGILDEAQANGNDPGARLSGGSPRASATDSPKIYTVTTTRKITPVSQQPVPVPLSPVDSTGYSSMTFTNNMMSTNNITSTNNFDSSINQIDGESSTSLEQRMLKQSMTQRTIEKKTLMTTTSTSSAQRTYRLGES